MEEERIKVFMTWVRATEVRAFVVSVFEEARLGRGVVVEVGT